MHITSVSADLALGLPDLRRRKGSLNIAVSQQCPDRMRERACSIGRMLWKEEEHDGTRNQQHTTAASSQSR